MSLNLLEIAKSHLTTSVIGKLGGLLGESESTTKSAVNSAVPSLLAGFMKKASTSEGADELDGMLGGYDGSLLDNIGGSLDAAGDDVAGFAKGGEGILGSVLGGGLGNVTNVISKAAGIGNGSAKSLLGILAPIIMSILGREKRNSGLDASGIAGLLSGQKSHLAGQLPDGIGDSLGLGNLSGGAADRVGDTAGAVAGGAGRAVGAAGDAVGGAGRAVGGAVSGGVDAAGNAAAKGGSILGKLIPLVLIGLLCFFGWKFLKRGGNAVKDGVAGIEMPKLDMPELPKIDLPGGGDFGGQLNDLVGKTGSTLTGITDEASATAAVPKIEGLTEGFGGLAGHLDKLPAAARGPVVGMIGKLSGTVGEQTSRIEAIPGVGGIVKPALDGLVGKLSMFK